MKHFLAWLKCRDAATAIEYALIVGGIAMVIIAAIFLAGTSLQLLWSSMDSSMGSAASKI